MTDAAANLRVALAQCYDVFADMRRPQTLDASPLRDGEQILQTLLTAPLRELSGEHIGPYAGWAMTTVGTDRDYRYFLPRILELSIADPAWPGMEPSVIAGKIQLASWQKWPSAQQSAVREFFAAAFNLAVETHPDDGLPAKDWLCGLIGLGEDPAPFMERWRSSASPNAALQLASFIIAEAKHLRRDRAVKGAFWEEVDEPARRQVAGFLLSDATAGCLRAAVGRITEEDRWYLVDVALAELPD